MRACPSFLSMIRICGQGKLSQGLPTDSHHSQQHLIRTATVRGWAHFSWWPDWLITAHIIQQAFSLLNIFWWNHYLIKNALTSLINVGSQDHKDFIRKVSVIPNEKPIPAFSLLLSNFHCRFTSWWTMTYAQHICIWNNSPLLLFPLLQLLPHPPHLILVLRPCSPKIF